MQSMSKAVLPILVATCLIAPTIAADENGVDFFEKRIRPVLDRHCYDCHSTRADDIEGGLRLDSRERILRGGDLGPAVVLGNPQASLLIHAIGHIGDTGLEMPPDEKKLPDTVIADFEQWIVQGIPFPSDEQDVRIAGRTDPTTLDVARRHWAFQPIVLPPPPNVENPVWPRSGIDRFILARLEDSQMRPSANADRRVLIRRACYNLHGLPPTPRDVSGFLSDSSPQALTRLVDRLLASPRYGERWARHWLDVARYSDSKGYVDAGEKRYPFAYTYRDYVVRAWNEDLPFDRFVLEQLAADQLPRPSVGRSEPENSEGENNALAALGFLTVGSRYNLFPHEIIDDRIDVVTRGLMGLTVTCARCHNHKYDSISAADYYALYGVFASSREPSPDEYPVLSVPSSDFHELDEFRQQIADKGKAYHELRDQLHKQIQYEMRSWIGDYLRYIVQLMPEHRTQSQPGLRIPRNGELIRDVSAYARGAVNRWRRFIRQCGPDDRVFGVWNRLVEFPKEAIADQTSGVLSELEDAGALNPLLRDALSDKPPHNLVDVATVYGELLQETEQMWTEELEKTPPPTAFADTAREELRQVLYAPQSPATMSVDESEDYYHLDESTDVRGKFKQIEEVFLNAKNLRPRAMLVVDRSQPIEPRIFIRGDAERLGPAVQRRMPGLLSHVHAEPFPTTSSGRLELARAIVHPANPLTARVVVNRVWAWHFTHGLVATPSDFGTRSLPPTHPDLLDYLASRFIQTGWSLKQLHRTILLSSTWQQTSNDRPLLRQTDPKNDLLWRMNRQRLDFESMRDSMLAVTGRLDEKIAGRPMASAPDDLQSNRRTMYLFVDRRNLPGLFRIFDFPTPDISSPKRPRTTVPGQTLFLLNSPFVIACAKELANELTERFGEQKFAKKVNYLHQIVYNRIAKESEITLADQFVHGPNGSVTDQDSQVAGEDSDDWMNYVQILLQSNEFLFVD